MTQQHGGHILTSKLKKSLEISMHFGGKDINLVAVKKQKKMVGKFWARFERPYLVTIPT